ncbi:MAG: ABC transporter permease subunit [Planctomycetales bacterium]|nr:ABC transporter permease subunit [Planctomycetales bacterium]
MIFVFCWARVWIVCQFDLQQLQPLLEQLRPFERFSPVPLTQLLTYRGSLAMTFHEPVLVLCILVWAIARGSDVVSGEINRGTLEMLLAQPIARGKLLACHAAVCVSGLAALCGLAWLGLYVGIRSNTIVERQTPTLQLSLPFVPLTLPLPVGPTTEMRLPLANSVDPAIYLAPSLNLFGFGVFVWGLSVLCSSVDRYRWRTLGIVIGCYVVQLLLFLLSKATSATAFCGYLTFLSAYQPDAMVYFADNSPDRAWWLSVPQEWATASWPHRLGPLGMTFLLLALGSSFFMGAAFWFRRRDIPAPL